MAHICKKNMIINSLIIPVFKNELNISILLEAINNMHKELSNDAVVSNYSNLWQIAYIGILEQCFQNYLNTFCKNIF